MLSVQIMELNILLLLSLLSAVSSWSLPYFQQRGPPVVRYSGFAPMPYQPVYRLPVPVRVVEVAENGEVEEEDQRSQRDPYDPERDDDPSRDHDHGSDLGSDQGVAGPVHTFVKTDRNANYKWGVRHHVGGKHPS